MRIRYIARLPHPGTTRGCALRSNPGTASRDHESCLPLFAGLRVRLACIPWSASIPLPAMAQIPSAMWSRPIRIHVCSMFARMSRYTPAARGIRSPPRIPATAQNGRSRQVPVSLDTSSERRIELSSGLLICGFGVQVPGAARTLTWGFTAPGHFLCVRFVSVLARVSEPGRRRPCQEWPNREQRRPSQLVNFLDQWSRPSVFWCRTLDTSSECRHTT